MQNRISLRLFFGLGAMALALTLAACGGAGEKTAVSPTVVSSETEPAIAPEETEATAVSDEPEEVVEPTAVTPKTTEIFTDDDRPDALRMWTDGWNTNWEKHTINYDEIMSGGPPRDGIPPIDDPKFISTDEAAEWVAANEPVIFLEVDGDARAYPLQIMTWHEIVNDTVGDTPVTVTFCPLCNSAIVFDRRVDGETYDFGTSGLLRNSDLIMWDRTTESLWQQFTGNAIAGDMVGVQLDFLPSSLVSFADFQALRPDGQVLSRDTGISRNYGRNPYAGYDEIGQNPFLFSGIPDDQLPAMERVVTIRLDDADLDIAYPLPILSEKGVIHDTQAGQDIVLFHKDGVSSALNTAVIAAGKDVGATAVFDPNLNGEKLIFTAVDDTFVDENTGSVWNILGEAVEGALAGERLEPIVHADHFWFSWAAFRPDTVIYEGS